MSLKATYESVPSEAEHYFEQHRWEWQDRFLRGSTALYDPIFTPLFTSLFTTLGFSATTAALLGAGAAAIATTALAIGIQALLAPKPPRPEDGKIPKVQSVPYRQWGVGRARVAGAYMLWEAVGKNLYAVQAIAGHRIKSVNRYWLHDDEVTLQPAARSIQAPTTIQTSRYSAASAWSQRPIIRQSRRLSQARACGRAVTGETVRLLSE